MEFEKIDQATWPRAEHFQYYSKILKTNFQINVSMDITRLYQRTKEKGIKFFPSFLYAVMRGINKNKEFRMACRDGELGFYNVCHPSYTIFHEDDKTFSDIWSEYTEDFSGFYRNVMNDMERYKNVKGVKTKPDKPDNFCPVSCIPWVSYSGICHDTPGPGPMYFPVINFGKYQKESKRVTLPFSVYANHAASDGYHVSKLIEDIGSLCDKCDEWMEVL